MPHCIDANQRHYCSSFQLRGESEWGACHRHQVAKKKVSQLRRARAGGCWLARTIADGALPPKSKEEVQVLSAELQRIVLILPHELSTHLHAVSQGAEAERVRGVGIVT